MGRDTSVHVHPEPNKTYEFPISHNIPTASAYSGFWAHNYQLHPTFSQSLLHQNLMPAFTSPNMHAFLMELNNLSNSMKSNRH